MDIRNVNTIQGLANFLNVDTNITDEFNVVKYTSCFELHVTTSDGKYYDFMTFDRKGNFKFSNNLTDESGSYMETVMKFIRYSDSSKWFSEPRYNVILIEDSNGNYSFLKKGKGYNDNLLYFAVVGKRHPQDGWEHSLDDEDSKFTSNEITDLRYKNDSLRKIVDLSATEIIE